jgi:hypothetical protein
MKVAVDISSFTKSRALLTINDSRFWMLEGDRVYPETYGAKGDGVADDSTAMQEAIDAYKALLTTYVTSGYYYDSWMGPIFTLKAGARYLCNTALYGGGSLTSCLKWVDFNGATIIGADADEPVLDMTGALGCVWWNGVIEGDPTTPPKMGIFLSRALAEGGAGNHFFNNMRVVGSFDYAPVYNYGSEMNVWLNCKLLNYAGLSGMILGDSNARAFDPTGGQAIAAGSQSAIGQFFYNTTLYNNDLTTGVLTNYSGLEIDGFSLVYWNGGLINCGYGQFGDAAHGAWASGHPYIVADSVSSGGVNYVCTAAHTSAAGTEPGVGATWATVWEGPPNRPQVLLRSTDSNPENIRFDGNIFHGAYSYSVEVEANTTVTGLKLHPASWGADSNNTVNSSYQLKLNASSVLRSAELDIPNVLASAVGAQILESKVNLASCKPGDWSDASDHHTFNLSGNFSGELIARSDDVLTLTSIASYYGSLFLVNTGMRHIWGQRIGYMVKNNAPGAGSISLAAADLINGFILDDPEGNANWTMPTAADLIAALPNARIGATFETILSNQATAASGEAITLVQNTGVTLVSLRLSETIVLTEGVNRGCLIKWRVDALAIPTVSGLVIMQG